MPTTPFMKAKAQLLAEAQPLGLHLSNRKLDKAAKKVLLLESGRKLGNGEYTQLTYADPTPETAFLRSAIREVLSEMAR